MSNWQIGESGTAIALDDTGRGELSLTVTNSGPAQDRAVLTVTPLDGAADSWFTIDQPPKAVPPGQSVTYLCTVVVPPEVAPAVYACQFVAYSADRDPGETSTTSRRVTLEKKAPAVAPRRTPWYALLIVAVVLAVVIGVVAWLVLDGDDGLANTEAPVIEGDPVVLANLTAAPGEWSDDGLSFTFEWLRCDSEGDDCDAIEGATLPAYPVGADDVERTLRVEVTATRGEDESAAAVSEPVGPVAPPPVVQVAVPDVVGRPRSEAVALLGASFQVVALTAGAPVDLCDPIVESQAPAVGTEVNQGEQVAISTRPGLPLRSCRDLTIAEQPFLSDAVLEAIPQSQFDDLLDGP